MSMGMQVDVVDEAEVKAVPGSNDTELLKWLLGRGRATGVYCLAGRRTGGPVPGVHPRQRPPGHIIAGRITRPDAGFVYANAFEFVCSSLGEWAHNCFHRCNPELDSQFDKLFKAHGVGLRFWDGLVGNAPVTLPDPGDGVLLGHWTESEVRAAASVFQAMRAAGPHGEPWFEEMLDEVGDWIAKVEARPGSMLVAA